MGHRVNIKVQQLDFCNPTQEANTQKIIYFVQSFCIFLEDIFLMLINKGLNCLNLFRREEGDAMY